MFRSLALILLIVLLTGCVTPMSTQEQLPDLDYATAETAMISVIDERERVMQGKPNTFIGVAHGAFGVPADWHVKQVLATEEGDKERNLAEWLEIRIVKGFNEEGWQAEAISLNRLPNVDKARSRLLENNADLMFVLVLHEWYFSINLNWVTAFNFDTDADLHVFQKEHGKIFVKTFKDRDVIDEEASQSPQNNILAAYKAQLQQIFGDEELRNAIDTPSAVEQTYFEPSTQPVISTETESPSPIVATENEEEPEGRRYSDIAVPANLTLRNIQQSIVTAGLGRKWQIMSSSDQMVVLHLRHRKYDSNLYFTYDTEKIVIFSDSYALRKGIKKEPKDPKGWIENLEKDISKLLNNVH